MQKPITSSTRIPRRAGSSSVDEYEAEVESQRNRRHLDLHLTSLLGTRGANTNKHLIVPSTTRHPACQMVRHELAGPQLQLGDN